MAFLLMYVKPISKKVDFVVCGLGWCILWDLRFGLIFFCEELFNLEEKCPLE